MAGSRAFATVLHGDGAHACGAAVLSANLHALEPTVPITVVASSIGRGTRAILESTGTLRVQHARPMPHALAKDRQYPAQKDELWALPYHKVLYFDIDHVPVVGDGTRRRLAALWELLPPHAELAAVTEGRQSANWPCFNSGMLLLRPSRQTRQRLDSVHPLQRLACNTALVAGTDQPKLNHVFARNWSRIRAHHWRLANSARTPRDACEEAVKTRQLTERADSFHFFSGRNGVSLPWRWGCEQCAARSQFCSVRGATLNATARRTNEACPAAYVASHVAWWAAFARLPALTQALCRDRMRETDNNRRAECRELTLDNIGRGRQ